MAASTPEGSFAPLPHKLASSRQATGEAGKPSDFMPVVCEHTSRFGSKLKSGGSPFVCALSTLVQLLWFFAVLE
jgi:hypothetical protein